MWAKILKKPPIWPLKSKRGLVFTAKNLLIEEAFLTPAYFFRKKVDDLRKTSWLLRKKSSFSKKVAKKLNSLDFIWPYNWTFGILIRPSDVEFQVELEGAKRCIHPKSPKQRDSNGRSEISFVVKECLHIRVVGYLFLVRTDTNKLMGQILNSTPNN